MWGQTSKFQLAALIGTLSLLTACTGGGGISSSSNSSGSSAVGITLVYPTGSGPTWTPIESGGRYYIKGTPSEVDLTITGTCSQGIATIYVNSGGSNYPTAATCTGNGTFTWSNTWTGTGPGNLTLNVVGYDINNAPLSGATTPVLVRIDNTPPNAVTVTQIGSTPSPPASFTYSGSGNSVVVQGSCSSDTSQVTVNSGTVLPVSPGNTPCWTYTATLGSGSSTFDFYAWDLAGNEAAAYVQTISAQISPLVLYATLSAAMVDDSVASSGQTLQTFLGPLYPGAITDSVGASNDVIEPGPIYETTSKR